jgi:hypothetical protein
MYTRLVAQSIRAMLALAKAAYPKSSKMRFPVLLAGWSASLIQHMVRA